MHQSRPGRSRSPVASEPGLGSPPAETPYPSHAPVPPASIHKPVTIRNLQDKKSRSQPISMMTAYDASQSRLCAEAGIDCVLVGDSLGMVVLGYESTLQVTMHDMIHHCAAVSRGNRHSFLIGDMPFLSYQADVAEAVRNAGRFLQEGGMHAVKLEGGTEYAPQIRAIVRAGIPVVGHLGLLPQHVHIYGGYRRQGIQIDSALAILDDARALVEAGISMLVLEAVPREVAARVAKEIPVPVIGIGAGAECDGQVLVFHDLLGLGGRTPPSFVRVYAQGADNLRQALSAWAADVTARTFPAASESFGFPESSRPGLEAEFRNRDTMHPSTERTRP